MCTSWILEQLVMDNSSEIHFGIIFLANTEIDTPTDVLHTHAEEISNMQSDLFI